MDLVLIFHTIILIFLVVTAFAAIALKDLFASIIIYGAYSFCMCLTYLILHSADVAMMEAALGAGLTTILFVAALAKTSRGKNGILSKSWEPSINVMDITRRMVPFILMFGVYIGGFQGVIVIGAGVIVYAMVFGLEKNV
ncbi:MAG: hydrogenase subunit MbhD domain-containing protein [bacterium]